MSWNVLDLVSNARKTSDLRFSPVTLCAYAPSKSPNENLLLRLPWDVTVNRSWIKACFFLVLFSWDVMVKLVL